MSPKGLAGGPELFLSSGTDQGEELEWDGATSPNGVVEASLHTIRLSLSRLMPQQKGVGQFAMESAQEVRGAPKNGTCISTA